MPECNFYIRQPLPALEDGIERELIVGSVIDPDGTFLRYTVYSDTGVGQERTIRTMPSVLYILAGGVIKQVSAVMLRNGMMSDDREMIQPLGDFSLELISELGNEGTRLYVPNEKTDLQPEPTEIADKINRKPWWQQVRERVFGVRQVVPAVLPVEGVGGNYYSHGLVETALLERLPRSPHLAWPSFILESKEQFVLPKKEQSPVFGKKTLILNQPGLQIWPLYKRVEADKVDLGEVVRIADHVGQALIVMHDAGAVHRDVKYSNVLFNQETADFMLTDFGTSRVLTSVADLNNNPTLWAYVEASDGYNALLGLDGRTDPLAPREAIRVRRPMYTEPEKVLELDKKHDVYSYGLLVYVLLRHVLGIYKDEWFEVRGESGVYNNIDRIYMDEYEFAHSQLSEIPGFPETTSVLRVLTNGEPSDRPNMERARIEALKALEMDLARLPR